MQSAKSRFTKPVTPLGKLGICRTALFAVMALFLASCATGPGDYTKTVTRSLENTEGTFLARAVARAGDPRDGRTGVKLVADGPEALELRLAIAEKAERTIDAQYYLLHNDEAGHLFAWSLVKAAERGVRVRLLIDDMDVAQYDAMSAALDKHPNIEIRLFNPFKRGFGKNVASLFEFNRVTRRMHNKSMTGDAVLSLVGGRNIGNEYFAAEEDSNYNDLDVLVAGPVAGQVSRTFDDYWNSTYAVPVSVAVQDRRNDLTLEEAMTRLSSLANAAEKSSFGSSLTKDARKRIGSSRLDLTWVPAKLIADPPEKAAGEAEAETLVAGQLLPYLDRARSSLYVSSAYFVPRQRGVDYLSALSARGVDVHILTNSVDSTDVLPVYGKYARSREDLLSAGVSLYELRADAERQDRERLGLGLSQSSLHTKAFILDESYLFVGSFNWDPRSVWLNNEMGILIESPVLAREWLPFFKRHLRKNAFKLQLDETGGIDWLTYLEDDGVSVLYRDEPTSSGWRLFKSRVYGVLPFGKQL
ncbi:phospholipase D family protein [Defluviimonas sp. D31]|uniref:phospholipase D family protein n=1 Tax=Defluviimonas sp. D31 TaxID=3083253 RepID=UPI00296E61B0|nr:phospholipase D family protein [Defluviimonas sp. D31]MDW4551744.1 phospholipase D family protein [Defluviimonas sp. D31]